MKPAPPALRIWHPFTQAALDAPPLRVVRGEGAHLILDDGGRVVDAISSWWVNIHGHGNPRIAAAIAAQARKLEQVILAGFTHDAAEELAQRLRKWLPAELTHMFFSDDGSTAVEVALKLAVQYWSNLGRAERSEIVALEHGYHGDTAGAMSVSDDSPFTAAFRGMRFPAHRVHSAYCHRCPVGLKRESCGIECAASLEKLLGERGERIAAVIVEPLLQGAGGMIVHPVEFLQKVRELCTRHGVLLIADEVLTGFGRTGKMFACEHAGIAPDLMCLSKGLTAGFLPMALTLTTERVEAAFRSEDRLRTFFHGHSFTGNALGCAAACASLQIFEDEPVFERIAGIAGIHAERLARLKEHAAVGEVRQIGTVAAVELRADDAGYLSSLRPRLYRFFRERGVLLRPLGNVIYVLPPYVIEPDELHRVHDVVAEAIQTLL
ncbi:MAG: adenosylmethionine--8-amino-7-oxononanoate transaminase [Acidobacteriia bacterium]|nr:adenosylmethionine--8-amino-7-oxononanoate transaminase [Terriglobia bacterium]